MIGNMRDYIGSHRHQSGIYTPFLPIRIIILHSSQAMPRLSSTPFLLVESKAPKPLNLVFHSEPHVIERTFFIISIFNNCSSYDFSTDSSAWLIIILIMFGVWGNTPTSK